MEDNIVEQGFVIDTPEKAEWALQKIAEEERAAQAYIDACKAQVERYTRLAEEREKKVEQDTSYLRVLLASYIKNGAPVRKAKASEALELPSGVVRRKYESYKMVPDEDKLIQTFDGSKYVDYTPKLKWGELKKSLAIVGEGTSDAKVINKETGEVVEGVDVEWVPETIEIKVADK